MIAADGEAVSYAQLDRWSAALANSYVRGGVAPGTRVLVALGMSPALYAVLIALWRIGAVAVFPDASSGISGLRHAVRAALPTRFVGWRWLGMLAATLAMRPSLTLSLAIERGVARADIAPWPDTHPALISFTSGSTGAPKGIVRTHGFLLAQQRALAPLLTPAEPTRDLVCLPLFVLAELGLGVTSAIPDADLRRPAQADAARLARQISRERMTRLLAPPSVAAGLAGQPEFGQLRSVFTGGGPVWPDTMRMLLAAAPLASIVAVYGSTEAEPIAHQALNDLSAADWAAMETGGGLIAGATAPGLGVRIVGDEIQVSGAHVNRGYLDPSQNVGNKVIEGGAVWHRTGDAGRLGADGRLWLLGRLDGRAGPYFPFAVEVAARSWPGVRQAALIEHEGRTLLVVAGTAECEPTWRQRATAFPGLDLLVLPKIPLDRRHQAKTDYATLRAMLGRERS